MWLVGINKVRRIREAANDVPRCLCLLPLFLPCALLLLPAKYWYGQAEPSRVRFCPVQSVKAWPAQSALPCPVQSAEAQYSKPLPPCCPSSCVGKCAMASFKHLQATLHCTVCSREKLRSLCNSARHGTSLTFAPN